MLSGSETSSYILLNKGFFAVAQNDGTKELWKRS